MAQERATIVHTDCLKFRGHVPCVPNKLRGRHCDGCPEFARREGRILVIKLGAAGDVIRTTPLLHPLKRDYPNHALSWITHSPSLLPSLVDDPLPLDVATALWARRTRFDLVINLDKDREACALAGEVAAPRKLGFLLDGGGVCVPVDERSAGASAADAARAKWVTGLFDGVSQANALSYVQEIFAICDYTFAGEEYVLDRPASQRAFDLPVPAAGCATVGLNTGCGGRWPSRLWPEPSWGALALALRAEGHAVVLLGGPDEDERNRRLAAATGATYPGHFELRTFIGLVDRCDVVVTAVTMAMHIAIGLRKQIVLINNIFNPREFELYGRGVIVQPEQPCTCYFQPRCTAPRFCLETLRPETVAAAVGERVAVL
jgi:ADP-heptose:LPS heptosyltransferase